MEHLKSNLQIDLAQRSEAGRKPENQDTVGARIPVGQLLASKGIAIAIADGVSSSDSARQASQTAVTGFLSDYYATPDTWSTPHSAEQVIRSFNRYLFSLGQNSVLHEGRLTTFSALVLKGDTAFGFHIGDSRIYRWREGQFDQLTRDHSHRIDDNTHYLSRAMGADFTVEIDTFSYDLRANDIFLLTTDGIHDVLGAPDLKQTLEDFSDDLERLVVTLANDALEQGSKDNISVQAVKVLSLGVQTQNDAVKILSRLPFPPLLEVGQKLDELTVVKILHESERSQIYLVKSAAGQLLAMKTPSVNYEDDPAYIERFVMEAWIGQRVQNANVVRVVQPVQPKSCLYYLTEFIAGPTLEILIEQRAPFDVADAVELAEQIVKGLRAFHRKDTLHQDIKPANLVMGSRGLTFIDFGSCWVAGVAEAGAPFKRDGILGTLDYSAPEYRVGGPKSQRSDQFSLAVIVYELLTKKKPYGDKYASTMNGKRLQNLKYIPATRHNPLVPLWMDRALEKALSFYPTSRYSSLSEFLVDLKRPNPRWTAVRDQPMIEKNPLLFWQLFATVGWLAALATLYFLLQ